ncbi:type II toxin-antitoxin system RelE/ParE family toxin [Syntrophobotulus glycolicus]|uniref:type II toxin-antitoxin system RelE/ParE family toxin n=1 Tax=Syntrophobotulus glycolicus TaxID=51197 RepID=UPI0003148097|nr:type II toxin-antitoxin system RelE/ParE family toxin [Syntrophobotulus glycolicus]
MIEYLKDLQSKSVTSKKERVRHKKIIEYFDVLAEYGTRARKPYVKHIEDDIWELRPKNYRFFFAYWKDNIFMMLRHCIKKTQKTSSP